MKKAFLGLAALCLVFLTLPTFAQFSPPCYKPITGARGVATPIQNSILCPACTFVQNAAAVTDNDTSNFAIYNTALGLTSGSGISVRDTVNTFAGRKLCWICN